MSKTFDMKEEFKLMKAQIGDLEDKLDSAVDMIEELFERVKKLDDTTAPLEVYGNEAKRPYT